MRSPQIVKATGMFIIGSAFPIWAITDRQSWLMVGAGVVLIALGSIQAAERPGGDDR